MLQSTRWLKLSLDEFVVQARKTEQRFTILDEHDFMLEVEQARFPDGSRGILQIRRTRHYVNVDSQVNFPEEVVADKYADIVIERLYRLSNTGYDVAAADILAEHGLDGIVQVRRRNERHTQKYFLFPSIRDVSKEEYWVENKGTENEIHHPIGVGETRKVITYVSDQDTVCDIYFTDALKADVMYTEIINRLLDVYIEKADAEAKKRGDNKLLEEHVEDVDHGKIIVELYDDGDHFTLHTANGIPDSDQYIKLGKGREDFGVALKLVNAIPGMHYGYGEQVPMLLDGMRRHAA